MLEYLKGVIDEIYWIVGSLKKTGIPVLAARSSPAKTATPGRSTSAIDLQAANRARQHHFSTLRYKRRVNLTLNTGHLKYESPTILNRTPLRTMGRTNSSMASPAVQSPAPGNSSAYASSSATTPGGMSGNNTGTNDRSRNRSRISRLSHSQRKSFRFKLKLNFIFLY